MSGGFSTRFSSLSDVELKTLFSSTCWFRPEMGYDARLEACQELENRLAVEDGITPRLVVGEDMDGATFGCQQGSLIRMNSNVLADGVFRAQYTDEQGETQIQEMEVMAPSWSVFDTVCHEHQHCAQEDLGFSQGPAYIQAESDYALYRIQPDERDAFAMGEHKTFQALSEVGNYLGYPDPAQGDYLASVAEDDYDRALARARLTYGDDNIQQAVDNVIRDYGNGVRYEYETPGEQGVARVLDEQERSYGNSMARGSAVQQGVSQEVAHVQEAAVQQGAGHRQDNEMSMGA